MAHDVFVSYSSKDKLVADALCAHLEAQGVRCWVAPRDVLPGRNWGEQIIDAIAASRAMVLIYSSHSNSSQQVLREVERAVNKNVVLVPFRVEDVPMSKGMEYLISTPHGLDASSPPIERHFARLARTVQYLLAATDQGAEALAEPAGVSDVRPPRRWKVASRPTEAPLTRRRQWVAFATVLLACSAAGSALFWRARLETEQALRSRPADDPAATIPASKPSAPGKATTLAHVVPVKAKAEMAFDRLKAIDPGDGFSDAMEEAAIVRHEAQAFFEQKEYAEAVQRYEVLLYQSNAIAARDKSRKQAAQTSRRYLVNLLKMEFVEITPGTFLMGTPPDQPQHRVRITKPFYMGVHEVTVGQFAAFVNTSGHKTGAETSGGLYVLHDGKEFKFDAAKSWRDVGFEQGNDHPVVGVSWNDAVAFCQWLGKKEGKTYRLPTEGEWEYACRAGTQTAYPWGDAADAGKGWCNAADLTAKGQFPEWETFNWRDGFVFTAPVGSYKPNAWGLHDMIGNVWEWCSDGYAPYPKGEAENPKGDPDSASRVLRGGAWHGLPRSCRSGFRHRDSPDYRYSLIGFRLVLDFP